MIKYLELTAPQTSIFRQAKIVSIECNEGDRVENGSTLFRVRSGDNEIDLPSTQNGRVVELIATVGESITLSTALLLLETEVDGSTATPPISETEQNDANEQKPPGKLNKAVPKETHSDEREPQKGVDSEHIAPELLVENFQLTQEVAPRIQSKRDNKPKDKPSTRATSKTMSSNSIIEVTVPDIGTDSAKVIEILVKTGDSVEAEDALITLESDKASMDVPSTHAGTISSIEVSLDEDVSEGSIIIKLETSAKDAETTNGEITVSAQNSNQTHAVNDQTTGEQEHQIMIPDIGGDSAKVIEILVAVGDQVNVEDALITLESDKASMDVPSTMAGEISHIDVTLDQEVSEGALLVKVISAASYKSNDSSDNIENNANKSASAPNQQPSKDKDQTLNSKKTVQDQNAKSLTPGSPDTRSHASPSVRRFARELGVDIGQVSGTGRKSRVTQDDVKGYVKGALGSGGSATSTPVSSGGAGIPPIPEQDFSKFGETELQPLNKIKRVTATNLHRAWLNVPHVTHDDEANISDLEEFRKKLNGEVAKQQADGVKLSPLAFIVKAVVHGLRKYPQFNSSLDGSGENLILKNYFNIGIAVETPNGLMVPVLHDADKKSITEIAKEMGSLAAKARDKKLSVSDMSGACFTISSLGGIGGTGFTPIVNAPEVAILGVSRSKISPVWNGKDFEPGVMLPLSLSYDHRVIDGAEAARFTRHIAAVLEDIRRLTV